MKTLMDCNAKEFLVQTNRMRKKVENLIKKIDFSSLQEKTKGIDKKLSAKEKLKAFYPIISEIVDICFENDVDTVFEIVAMARFDSVENIEKLEPCEIMDTIQNMIQSKRVFDFFTSLARSVGSIMGILSHR